MYYYILNNPLELIILTAEFALMARAKFRKNRCSLSGIATTCV